MKILILAKFLRKDGATIHMFTVANGLAERGHEVHLMSGGPPNDDRSLKLFNEFLEGRVQHHKVGFPNYAKFDFFSKVKQLLTYIAIIPHTLWSIIKISPDIIHVHYPVTSYIASIYCAIAKKRYVTTYHIKGIPKQILHRKAHKAIAISSEMKDELNGRWRYNENEISLVFNGIPEDKFNQYISKEDKPKFKERLNLPQDKLIIGFVGTYEYKKGLDLLLESCSKLNRNDFCIVLLGDGDTDWIKSLINKFGMNDKVILRGFQDPVDYYAAFDVFVLPSRNEGFGLVAVEAMMMGVPTIRSNTAGAHDMITPGKDGYIFSSGNIEELCYQVQTLLEDENLRKEVGLKGKEKALSNFTESIMLDKLINTYNSLIK